MFNGAQFEHGRVLTPVVKPSKGPNYLILQF